MTPAQKKSLDTLKTKFGLTTIPVEVWVDGDGRVRKLSETIDMSKATGAAAAAAQAGAVNLTMEIYDYGTSVHIDAPPPDQVADITNALQGATSSGSGTSGP